MAGENQITHIRKRSGDIADFDKIKIVCDRKHENTEMLYHGANEIDEMCYAQLKALTRLFPENSTLNREITEVI